MYFYEGHSCPVCGQPFKENEDIVACPQCGLPHHRVCWLSEGHCHLAHLHNTDEQWHREKNPETANHAKTVCNENEPPRQACTNCGTKNAEFAEFCQHCGAPLKGGYSWQSAASTDTSSHVYQPFYSAQQPSQSNDADDLENGVTAQDAGAFIGAKAKYYIPRFQRMAQSGSNTSWNWAAFIFGPFWLLYRKMYAWGVLVMLLDIVQITLTQIAYNAMGLALSDYTSYAEIYAFVESAVSNPTNRYFLLAIFLLSALSIFITFGLALFGNRLYREHCKKKILSAREQTPDLTPGELSTIGGTSIAVTIIGYFAQYFITQILFMFI